MKLKYDFRDTCELRRAEGEEERVKKIHDTWLRTDHASRVSLAIMKTAMACNIKGNKVGSE